jgi:hypothetical protein
MFASARSVITVGPRLLFLGELISKGRHLLAAALKQRLDFWWIFSLGSALSDLAILFVQVRFVVTIIGFDNRDFLATEGGNPAENFLAGSAILKVGHQILYRDATGGQLQSAAAIDYVNISCHGIRLPYSNLALIHQGDACDSTECAEHTQSTRYHIEIFRAADAFRRTWFERYVLRMSDHDPFAILHQQGERPKRPSTHQFQDVRAERI